MEAEDPYDEGVGILRHELMIVVESGFEQFVFLFADGLDEVLAVLRVVDEAAAFPRTDLLGEGAQPPQHQTADKILRSYALQIGLGSDSAHPPDIVENLGGIIHEGVAEVLIVLVVSLVD